MFSFLKTGLVRIPIALNFFEIIFILHRGTRDHPDRFSPTFSSWVERRPHHHANLVLAPIIGQWNPVVRQGDAVEHDLPDATINPLRVLDADQVRRLAEPVGELEPRPIPGNAGVDL